MRNYNLVESIIKESYTIKRKTEQGFFSSKVVETESLVRKRKSIYKNGKLFKVEEISKQYDGSLQRMIGTKKELDNAEYCWEYETTNGNGNVIRKSIYKYNKKEDCYYEHIEDLTQRTNRYEEYELTYDYKGLLVKQKSESSYYSPCFPCSHSKGKEYRYEYNSNGERSKEIWSNPSDNYRGEKHYIYENGYLLEEKSFSNGGSGFNLMLYETIRYKVNKYGDIIEEVITKDNSKDIYIYEREYDYNGFQTECRLYKNGNLTTFWKYIIDYKE